MKPLHTFDVCDSPDVVFGGEDKLVVQDPLWLVVKAGGRVELNHLVVFDGHVMACTFQVSNLEGQPFQCSCFMP